MISVVICSVDERKLSRVSEMYERMLGHGPFEIVAIRDAASLAEGYNRGLSRSSGSIIIFSHDDVEFLSPDFRERLLAHMSACDVVGVVGTARLADARWWKGSGMPFVYGQAAYPGKDGGYDVIIWSVPTRRIDAIQAMDGMFLCATRAAAISLGFDEQNFQGFHLYDLDFTFRAHLGGLRCAVANDLFIIHESEGKHDENWRQYADRFLKKYEGKLAPALNRHFRSASVHVEDKQNVLRVMSPSEWTT